jgi:hypothetical protein
LIGDKIEEGIVVAFKMGFIESLIGKLKWRGRFF